MPDIGEKLPEFTLPRDGGGTMSNEDFAGKILVLFFYPRDDTPGCTKESIGFTEQKADFDTAGAVVVGVSKDTVKSHDKFVEKHNLGVPLLSDTEGTLCEDLAVWVEKNNYGKKYMGIERATFIVDGEGIIRHIWRKVKVAGHVDTVLDTVKSL